MTKDCLLVFLIKPQRSPSCLLLLCFYKPPLSAKPPHIAINSKNPFSFLTEALKPLAMETPTTKPDTVLILHYGSHYTHLITRLIRSLNVFSLVISGTSSLQSITSYNPRVVILSGRPHSVHALDAPSFPDGFLEWAESNGVHVLGICYGLHLIVQKLGGVVVEGESKEHGKMEIEVKGKSEIFGSESAGDKQMVWMSHGDEVVRLPQGFEVVAQSSQGAVAALENRKKKIYGLQYHPEVLKLE